MKITTTINTATITSAAAGNNFLWVQNLVFYFPFRWVDKRNSSDLDQVKMAD